MDYRTREGMRQLREAAEASHKWFREEATPDEQRKFLDSTCPPEPGDYYDEEGVKRAWEKRQKKRARQTSPK